MREQFADAAIQLWCALHRVGAFVVLNLLDEPVILAMAFC